jgi:hypothetical protein
MRRLVSRRNGERGFVTVELVAGMAFLMLPTTLLVVLLPTYAERVSMTRMASREAARVLVLTQSEAQAEATVRTIAANYKLPNTSLSVVFTGDPPTQRGGEVTATVSTNIPALQIPFFEIEVGEITVNESHTEIVDLYRSRG